MPTCERGLFMRGSNFTVLNGKILMFASVVTCGRWLLARGGHPRRFDLQSNPTLWAPS